jgi:uncharacterized coiled-coil DUF342 family protein
MAVQPQRPVWTDERLDDLSRSVREGFARNDAEHLAFREEMREMRREFREEMGATRSEMHEGFAEQNHQVNALHHQLDALQRTMIASLASLAIAIIGAALISNSSLF